MGAFAFFDSHAHYDDDRFAKEAQSGAALLQTLFDSGAVTGVCNAASDLASSRAAAALAAQFPCVWASCGIHPHEAAAAGDMEDAMAALEQLLQNEKTVAIGEIGLDYHYDFSPREVQRAWFARQLVLAQKTGYPVIIHCREAVGDTVALLRAAPGVSGIIHSCSCSAETVRELVQLGYYISFSGSVTFKNAAGLLDAVRAVPDDRLLIETDCPYLAPVPMRGRLNHSGYLCYTAQAVADARGAALADIAALTARNARRVFRL